MSAVWRLPMPANPRLWEFLCPGHYKKHRNTQQEDLWKNRGAKVRASKGSCFPCKFHVRSLWRHNLLIQGRLVMVSSMSTDLCLMPVVFFLTILSISMHFSVGLFERVWRVWSTMALAFSSWHNSSASAWHSIVVVKTSAASDVFLIYMYVQYVHIYMYVQYVHIYIYYV